MFSTAKVISFLGAAAVGVVMLRDASAATIQTLGSGSTVSVIERSATFDSLTSISTQELGNYSEGGLYITTGNQS